MNMQTNVQSNTESTERFLDYLIHPDECIDTLGRSYLDDLEHILVENHVFDFEKQTFPDKETQKWFDQVRSELQLRNMEEFIAYVRSRRGELDLASVRPRISFSDTVLDATPSHDVLKREGYSVGRSNAFQREYSLQAVQNIPDNERDPDFFELYMNSDRVSPWTFLIRREIARGNLLTDEPVICIGNRWLGEILYFRQTLGLVRAKGVDLFSSDPELVVAADMHVMPFADDSIRLVFARGLINKSYDVRLLMRETLRVLKPDGYLIIETPIYRDGLSRLGPTDIKSTTNLLRLWRGKISRIIYSDELDGDKANLHTSNGMRLARFFVQIDKNGAIATPVAEPFPQRKFRYYNALRMYRLRRVVHKKLRRTAGVPQLWQLILAPFSRIKRAVLGPQQSPR
jgi:SAM-dependent methyltransferase